MTIKETVYKLNEIEGINANVNDGEITVSNKLKNYSFTFSNAALKSIAFTKNEERGMQLFFTDMPTLGVSSDDFFVSTSDSIDNIQIEGLPPFISIKEIIGELNHFTNSCQDETNIDYLWAKYLSLYAYLLAAKNAGFHMDQQIAKLYSIYSKIKEQIPDTPMDLFSGVYLGNNGMHLIKLKPVSCYGISDFIQYWSAQYSYTDSHRYDENIDKEILEVEELKKLYEWKNGMALSDKKLSSFNNKVTPLLNLINDYRSSKHTLNVHDVLEKLTGLSAVWKVFALHICAPDKFPIYDQHVHRAYNFFHDLPIDEIDNTISDKKKLDFYTSTYFPFVEGNNIENLKQMDEAFFAFGKFLKTGNQKALLEEM